MDDILLKKVKREIYALKELHVKKFGALELERIKAEVDKTYDIYKNNAYVLKKVQQGDLLNNSSEYENCLRELKSLIADVIVLTIYFIRQQDYNIDLTSKRLESGDADSYLQISDKELVNVQNSCSKNAFYKELLDGINAYTNKEINEVSNRYTESFGDFRSLEEANKIIQMEYNHANKYIELFSYAKEKIFEKVDNYDPIISFLQTIAYELIQLSAVLKRAGRISKC